MTGLLWRYFLVLFFSCASYFSHAKTTVKLGQSTIERKGTLDQNKPADHITSVVIREGYNVDGIRLDFIDQVANFLRCDLSNFDAATMLTEQTTSFEESIAGLKLKRKQIRRIWPVLDFMQLSGADLRLDGQSYNKIFQDVLGAMSNAISHIVMGQKFNYQHLDLHTDFCPILLNDKYPGASSGRQDNYRIAELHDAANTWRGQYLRLENEVNDTYARFILAVSLLNEQTWFSRWYISEGYKLMDADKPTDGRPHEEL